MTYNPNIPNATDNISTSQSQLKTNFQQLDTIFDNDHYTFDNGTPGNRGYHRQVYFPAASVSDPSLGSFAGVVYLKNDANDTSTRPQIYYKNATGVAQVTNRFNQASTSGYCQIAGGIILMWGSTNATSSGNHTILFNNISNYTGSPFGFPNNVFNVTFTIMSPSVGGAPNIILDQTSPPTTTGFSIRVSASVPNTSIKWFAIGN